MTLDEVLTNMTAALQPLTEQIPDLQINPYFNQNPTPPSIDIYPADPFQEGAGFGVGEKKVNWNVRARVSTADPESASRLLLRLMDTQDPASVEAALQDVAVIGNDGTVSGFVVFQADSDMLGVLWRTEMYV